MQPQDTTQPIFIKLHGKAVDLTEIRFGRLLALGPISKTRFGNLVWQCQCDCGKICNVASSDLRKGDTKSCGCWNSDMLKSRNTSHGLAHTFIYRTWRHIIGRCTNPTNSRYVDYGGRGITISPEWRHDFLVFHDHVSGLPHCGEEGYSLDRQNNSLGYFPGNVRWATPTQQMRNTRVNRMVEFAGKTQPLIVWAEKLGIKYRTLRSRVHLGWSIEEALTTPVGEKRR